MGEEGRAKRDGLAVRAGQGEGRRDRVLEGRVPALESHYQELWFALARSRWNSLALVPADPGYSAAGVAAKLADVGRRLRHTPVTFLVMAGEIEFPSAGKFVSAVGRNAAQVGDEPLSARVVIAVPSVIVEPLAIAVTEAADAVVLYVRKGSTRRKSVERTIELVGRDRILGCVLG